MSKLTDSSLEFAKAHIESYYDSDFFPRPTLYEGLWAEWANVKTYLLSRNVENIVGGEGRSFPAPKARGGYRMVHQPEPLTSLSYTALASLVSSDVEKRRMPVAERTVFSYRIELDSCGFFAKGNGYSDYLERCRELSSQFQYVLTADLAEFYNRIYLHRLNTNLVAAGVAPKLAKSVEEFLTRGNVKASQGIPVGPAASIVMAEAVLFDIDDRIRDSGFVHARYVDDIRVFANDSSSLEALLADLVGYLHHGHRLQFAWAKTGVLSCADFAGRYLDAPESVAQRQLLAVARLIGNYPDTYTEEDAPGLLRTFLEANKDVDEDDELLRDLLKFFETQDESNKRLVRSEALGRLLELAASSSPMDLGLARYVLKTSRAISVPDVFGAALKWFEELAPAAPELFLYLQKVTTSALVDEYRSSLRALRLAPSVRCSEFLKHWLSWYYSSCDPLLADPEVRRYVFSSETPIEFQAEAAKRTGNLAWFRNQRARLALISPWDRWATIVASRAIPLDERKGWLNALSFDAESIERWLTDWATSTP